MTRKILLVVMLVLLLVGLVLVMPLPSSDQLDFPSDSELHVLGTVDPDWTLQTLDGREVRFAQFQGKVVFLNFWARWCGPCVAEMPGIQDLHDGLKNNDGVAFVLATVDRPERVRRFLEHQQLHLPVYVSTAPLPSGLDASEIPVTYIINQRGEIVFRHLGAARWDTDACRSFLEHLLEAGPKKG